MMPVKCPTSAEDDMPMCTEFADDKWDEEFMSDLGPANKLVCPESNSDLYEDTNAWEDTSPHLKSFDEAFSCLGDICNFLENKGYTCTSLASQTHSAAFSSFRINMRGEGLAHCLCPFGSMIS